MQFENRAREQLLIVRESVLATLVWSRRKKLKNLGVDRVNLFTDPLID